MTRAAGSSARCVARRFARAHRNCSTTAAKTIARQRDSAGTDTASRGAAAEALACDYLLARGHVLLTRNYRCRQGEIDLVLQDKDTLVFVEVRYRRQSAFGSAAESVDSRKQARLVACARHYLNTCRQAGSQGCRFDVVAIDGPDESITWIRDAFSAGG